MIGQLFTTGIGILWLLRRHANAINNPGDDNKWIIEGFFEE